MVNIDYIANKIYYYGIFRLKIFSKLHLVFKTFYLLVNIPKELSFSRASGGPPPPPFWISF